MFLIPTVLSGLVALSAETRPASRATTTQTSGDAAVDRLLDRLEKRGEGVHALSARLQADFHDLVADDKQTKQGSLWFRRDKPNPKFKVIYDKSIYEDYQVADVHEYLFDGRWLIEKHDKSRTYVRREIVAEGETIDPFRIGGPFPLPFGQRKAEILEHFTATLLPRSPKDPPGTDHLKLVPYKHSPMVDKYVELHFHIDQKIELPIRVVSHQRRPGSTEVDEIVSVSFKDIQVNPTISDGVLMIAKPTGKDWHLSEEPLGPNPPPPTHRSPP